MAHDHHHHGHGHGHAHGHHHAPVDTGDWRYLVALALNLGFVIVEFWAGLISGSTALMADAGHNLSDVLALALAGGAAWLARKRARDSLTYGYRKGTVLAALANAILLLAACGWITWEAFQRLMNPVEVASGFIVVVAGIGFVINLGTALLFLRDQHKDLNVRGAYLHMMADAAVSLGVVAAGLVIMFSGWTIIDPMISLVIVAVILWATWGLLKDSVTLALDGAPAGMDVSAVRQALLALPGVAAVHDLHVWGLSTTDAALTAHLVRSAAAPADLLAQAQKAAAGFGVTHTTFQIEDAAQADCPDC
ncbi:cation diffusion facilitator family transporter [Brevundimonas sp.]|uniref:cation diffusion facilitator family transporter n=1 Tax=Brevundimonas sp. TaxID=1871086 RepID=UPI001D66C3A4|nr:cation diffusion facilitator family transporter [Brevundimonas sp.]MBA4000996.1 cation transporter [Brevundimonas sp.]